MANYERVFPMEQKGRYIPWQGIDTIGTRLWSPCYARRISLIQCNSEGGLHFFGSGDKMVPGLLYLRVMGRGRRKGFLQGILSLFSSRNHSQGYESSFTRHTRGR